MAEDRFFVQMSEEQQSLGDDNEDNEGDAAAAEEVNSAVAQQSRNSPRFNRGIFWH